MVGQGYLDPESCISSVSRWIQSCGHKTFHFDALQSTSMIKKRDLTNTVPQMIEKRDVTDRVIQLTSFGAKNVTVTNRGIQLTF